MNRFAILFSFVLILAAANPSTGQELRIIDRIVGAVGGEVILLSDIEGQLAYMKAQRGSLRPNSQCEVMENLLGQSLMLHRARIDSLQVGDEEVDNQITARMDRILALMNNDFQQFEDYYGKSVGEMRNEFRDPIRNQLLVERMQAKIMSSISTTPSEVRQFFSRVPKDSLPYLNSEVELAEIMYLPKVNETQKQDAYLRASRLRKLVVEENEDFAEVARTHSEDLGSARLGGDLGWQKRGTFVPEFEEAAYSLEPGEISPVFESPFGYHFVQLIERRGSMLHSRHVLVIPKIMSDDLVKARNFLDSLRTVIADSTKGLTFEAALKEHGEKENQSYNNGGRMVNPKTNNTFFEISDLDPNLFFAIDTLEIGEMSAPIESRDPSGRVFYQMIKLLSRTKPHKASLKQDYARIQEATLAEKKARHLSDWVSTHIGSTYINLSEDYRGCANLEPWFKEEAVRTQKP